MKWFQTLLVLSGFGLLFADAFCGHSAKAWAARGVILAGPLYFSEDAETREGENVSIEYCTGCRWMLRSAWMAQELLTTFQEELGSVTLIPSRPPAPGGVFRVESNGELIWDRKKDGGFPESKVLKQRLRDLIAPTLSLGHSDTADKQEETSAKAHDTTNCEDCPKDPTPSASSRESASCVFQGCAPSPNIAVTYCTGCRWLLRAAWYAQELLTTFDTELNSVTLIPSRPPAPGGAFLIELDGELVWDRSTMGGFPELKQLKQMIRDKIAPSHDLGHSDKTQSPDEPEFEEMDDDEAADMRRFFGVM